MIGGDGRSEMHVGPGGFTDVPSGSFYYDAVNWAVDKGITNGTSTTTFSPDNACTRKEVVTFLWRAFGSSEPSTSSTPFTDIRSTDYYYKAVCWAVKSGITNGMTASSFGPDIVCTRAHVVTFLYRAKGHPLKQAAYIGPSVSTVGKFVDVPSNSYYAGAVLWAVDNGVTNGMDATHFGPDLACTRAHVVTFLYRALFKPLPSGGDELPIIPIG